jgi:hypothetical protein
MFSEGRNPSRLRPLNSPAASASPNPSRSSVIPTAWFQQEKDLFYVVAFTIQCCLSGLLHSATAEYAQKKKPKEGWAETFLCPRTRASETSPPVSAVVTQIAPAPTASAPV